MKIVHLCLSSFYIDDYSYQENMLPKYHMKMGLDVSVIASLVSFDNVGKPCILPEAKTYFSKDGFKVVRLNYKGGFFRRINSFVRRYENLISRLKEEKPDILFIHDYSFLDIIPVMNYVKANNVKVYIDCHTDYINSASNWISKHIFHHIIWRYIGRSISPFVEKFYGVTPLRCDFLKEAYRIDHRKVELLKMGIDDELLKLKEVQGVGSIVRDKLDLNDKFVIVTGGKIDYLKNIHLVVEAFRDLAQQYNDIVLVVFGTIAPEIQTEMVRMLDFPQIKFVGWLSSAEILDYFIMADLIVFPGTHSVLWEQAVGTGTPSIFKFWEGMDHVDVGGNARFIYSDSSEAVKSVLDEILHNDMLVYQDMLTKAREVGGQDFAYSKIAEKSLGYDY